MPPPTGKRWLRNQLRTEASVWPAMTIGMRVVLSSLMRVRCAPSDPRRPLATSTTSWSTSAESAHVDDAPRDVVKRLARGEGARQLGGLVAKSLLGTTQLAQQPSVVDRRRRVIGQRAKDGQLLVVERVRAVGEGAEHAQRLVVGEHGRRGHRAHLGRGHDLVGHGMVRETFVCGVVMGEKSVHDAPLQCRTCRARLAGAGPAAFAARRHW